MEKIFTPRFSEFDTEAFRWYLKEHAGEFTALEFSEKFMDGKYTANQVFGKALANDLTSCFLPKKKNENYLMLNGKKYKLGEITE